MKYCPYATEILPYLTILRKKPKELRNYGLRTSCHGVCLSSRSTWHCPAVTPGLTLGRGPGPRQNPHQQSHLQSQPQKGSRSGIVEFVATRVVIKRASNHLEDLVPHGTSLEVQWLRLCFPMQGA